MNTIKHKVVKVRVTIQGDRLVIEADEEVLKQILTQLRKELGTEQENIRYCG